MSSAATRPSAARTSTRSEVPRGAGSCERRSWRASSGGSSVKNSGISAEPECQGHEVCGQGEDCRGSHAQHGPDGPPAHCNAPQRNDLEQREGECQEGRPEQGQGDPEERCRKQ